MNRYNIVARALDFATTAHAGQTRKESGLPYILHPIAVSNILVQWNQKYELFKGVNAGENVSAAALLHDVIEDCEGYTERDIVYNFGETIAEYVVGLTKASLHSKESRAVRKAQDNEFLEKQSEIIQIIKVADIYHNSLDILQSKDTKWAMKFLDEKIDCVSVALTKVPVDLRLFITVHLSKAKLELLRREWDLSAVI